MSKFDATGYPDLKPYPASEAARRAIEAELSRLAVEAGEASGVHLTYQGNGEVFIKATDKTHPHASHCGKFGAKLAEILNEAKPRCGAIEYGRKATMMDYSGWCWVLPGALTQALKKREI